MGVSGNIGTPKSSILIGFSIINHPFWGTSIFGNTHIGSQEKTLNFHQNLIGILLSCTYNIMFPNNHQVLHGRVHQYYSLSTFFWATLTPKNSAKMQSTSQCFVETWPPHASWPQDCMYPGAPKTELNYDEHKRPSLTPSKGITVNHGHSRAIHCAKA